MNRDAEINSAWHYFFYEKERTYKSRFQIILRQTQYKNLERQREYYGLYFTSWAFPISRDRQRHFSFRKTLSPQIVPNRTQSSTERERISKAKGDFNQPTIHQILNKFLKKKCSKMTTIYWVLKCSTLLNQRIKSIFNVINLISKKRYRNDIKTDI